MKYSKEERIEIGRKIHKSGLSNLKAGELFALSEESARRYRILYEQSQGIEHSSSHVRKEGKVTVPPITPGEPLSTLRTILQCLEKNLCACMEVSRSSFYYWKNRLSHPADRTKALIGNILLFMEYHERYPSHGYRWLNAKIRLDTGVTVSDVYAHKCCKIAGIKSKSKHYKYKKPGPLFKVYPNLLLSELNIIRSMSRAGTPTDNEHIQDEISQYIKFFNEERPAYSLNYLTPKQFRQQYNPV
ncbi:MAG: IS3 family transposase [Emergencia sp.]|nr:IS3 family transposase [Emergencia sp.]